MEWWGWVLIAFGVVLALEALVSLWWYRRKRLSEQPTKGGDASNRENSKWERELGATDQIRSQLVPLNDDGCGGAHQQVTNFSIPDLSDILPSDSVSRPMNNDTFPSGSSFAQNSFASAHMSSSLLKSPSNGSGSYVPPVDSDGGGGGGITSGTNDSVAVSIPNALSQKSSGLLRVDTDTSFSQQQRGSYLLAQAGAPAPYIPPRQPSDSVTSRPGGANARGTPGGGRRGGGGVLSNSYTESVGNDSGGSIHVQDHQKSWVPRQRAAPPTFVSTADVHY